MRYCILVTNPGTLAVSDVIAVDTLPGGITYLAGSTRTGATCNAATVVEDDDAIGADESDPYGVSFVGNTLTAITATLAAGAAFAFRFDAIID